MNESSREPLRWVSRRGQPFSKRGRRKRRVGGRQQHAWRFFARSDDALRCWKGRERVLAGSTRGPVRGSPGGR